MINSKEAMNHGKDSAGDICTNRISLGIYQKEQNKYPN
jgi:hypothetical protein